LTGHYCFLERSLDDLVPPAYGYETAMANKLLQILMVEDNATDGGLVKDELARAGLKFNFKRVETDGEFLNELRRHPPDLVLSDHGLPTFDALTALAIVRDRDPD